MRVRWGLLVVLLAVGGCGLRADVRSAELVANETSTTTSTTSSTTSTTSTSVPTTTTTVAPATTTTTAPPVGDALWNRVFQSSAVTGGERPLVPGSSVSVFFWKNPSAGGLGWSGGCNSSGGEVAITADRLDVTPGDGSTAVGCDQALYDQDAWMGRFMASDPYWTLNGSRLTLRSGDTLIAFDEAPRWW